MNKFYKLFFFTTLSALIFCAIFFIWYIKSPDWISRNIIHHIIPFEKKIFLRKYFIEKNLRKHINTIDHNQFVNLGFKKYDLEFDYDIKKNINYIVYQNYSHIDIWKDKLILANAAGEFYYSELDSIKKNKFKKNKIKSNLKNLIIKPGFSTKDILVDDRYVYISYVTLKKSDCISLVIERAEFDLKKLEFQKFFDPLECIHKSQALFNFLHPGQAGGRLSNYKKNRLLLTTGNFRSPTVSQNNNSIYGKILEIDKIKKTYEVFSKGHRNPQGLDVKDDVIVSTEHAAYGGDEINLIKKNGNYGWPISSYGEKYSHRKSSDKYFYKKNHDGFIEPIFAFLPSIGISQIINLPNSFNSKWKNNYLLTSLAGNSIYRIKFSKDYNKILYYETIYIGERIRDIVYSEKFKMILLVLEDTGTLGVIFNKKNEN